MGLTISTVVVGLLNPNSANVNLVSPIDIGYSFSSNVVTNDGGISSDPPVLPEIVLVTADAK